MYKKTNIMLLCALLRFFGQHFGAAMSSWVVCSVLLYASAFGTKVLSQTDDDIRKITGQIWAADKNRLADSDVVYNVKANKLFTKVNKAALKKGTYAKMIDLFDNYNHYIGVEDTCDANCKKEENAFLAAILNTGPIKIARNWLVSRGLAREKMFSEELRQYWFSRYSRSNGPLDSSGFEHTFVGEINKRDAAVTGLHNWVQMYLEQNDKKSKFTRTAHNKSCAPAIESISFKWLNYQKPESSVFMRTSPEVEIALYTVCLLARPGNNCPIKLGDNLLTMNVGTRRIENGVTVFNAFPNC